MTGAYDHALPLDLRLINPPHDLRWSHTGDNPSRSEKSH